MEKRTNKDTLIKGIKILGITAILMFVGPTVVYISLTDKTQAVFIPLISIGFLICAAAIYFGFKGIKTIMDSMFNNEEFK